MKALLTYWIVGCVIIGLIAGAAAGKCPNSEIKNADIIMMVATWPILFAGIPTYAMTCDPARERKSECLETKQP